MRESPQHGTSDFSRLKVFSDIFNRSNFEYSALSGLKVDNMGRKIKKKKRKKEKGKKKKSKKKEAKQEKQYSSWDKRTQPKERRCINSVLKNHKFFMNIGNCRDISDKICQLFAHFWPVKFWSRDRAPPNSICIKHS